MSSVVLYTKAWCPYCNMAKRLLEQKGQEWQEIDVESDVGRRDEMIERSGRRTVPQIFIDERHVGGFDDLSALVEASPGRFGTPLAETVPGCVGGRVWVRFGCHTRAGVGGTTAAALYFLEKAGFRTALSRAIWAAYERSQELGKDARAHAPEDA